MDQPLCNNSDSDSELDALQNLWICPNTKEIKDNRRIKKTEVQKFRKRSAHYNFEMKGENSMVNDEDDEESSEDETAKGKRLMAQKFQNDIDKEEYEDTDQEKNVCVSVGDDDEDEDDEEKNEDIDDSGCDATYRVVCPICDFVASDQTIMDEHLGTNHGY